MDITDILYVNPSIVVKEMDEGLVVMVPEKDAIVLEGAYTLFLRFLAAADGQKSFADIEESLQAEDYYDFTELREIYQFCLSENIVKQKTSDYKSVLDSYSATKHNRQVTNFLTLPDTNLEQAEGYQQRLNEANVVLLGIGGVGGYIAAGCAMMGIGNLSLIDMDTIELSNTSRQILYREPDIGRKKLEVAKEDLLKRSSHTRIHTYDKEIQQASDLSEILGEVKMKTKKEIDLVICAADTPRGELLYIVSDACEEVGVPYLFLGPYQFSHAFIGPLLIPGKTKSWSDIHSRTQFHKNEYVDKINANFVASIIDPYNGVAAKMALIEVLKFLTGYREAEVLERRIDINTNDWTIKHYEY